ncbi:MAG: glutamate-1-semialdehyde 2,1-aminomutase [Candidatus Methanofastidiosum sp.]|nr:glutamate-1-semialdehyde 2,1-aminomutase [Methanofastidiosum sp.]NYT04336.1 glutamate-1-semialdehyde 2,1-aminomutase [Candidatus Methanofastidiosa archaeon]
MRNNKDLFEESKKYLCGGVNSPVRAMKPYPFFTERAKGAMLLDAEGKSYIDYCLCYGPMMLGHKNPEIIDAVKHQLEKGTAYGTPTENEIIFAKRLSQIVPNVEKIRCVSTGTEATMSAIRLARGITEREKMVKFDGGFHGAHDVVLVKAGSGVMTNAIPGSKGIPENSVKNTVSVQFNNIEALSTVIEKGDVAGIIIEPIIANAGCIIPEKGYLKEVKRIAKQNGTLLIMDEVITGFRLSLGGAQEYFKVNGDIITMGKIIGGGFPLAVFGGKKKIMKEVSPEGHVYNAGTFNGNPVSITAGLKTLDILERKDTYTKITEMTNKLMDGLSDMTAKMKTALYGAPGMFCLYFGVEEVKNYEDAKKSDTDMFKKFHTELLKRGVFLPPSQFECNFLSIDHGEVIDKTLESMDSALKAIKR